MSSDGPEGSKKTRPPWSIPSWKRVGDFVLTVAQLERSYRSLKTANDVLKDEVVKLQTQVAMHEGQLAVLMTFVQASIREQVEMSAERAASRQVEKLISQGSAPPKGDAKESSEK